MATAPFAPRWTILPLSLLTTTGVVLWVTLGLGGLGRTGKKLFNWHPALMSLTAVLLIPQGVLLWSRSAGSPSGAERGRTKWAHAAVLTVGFIIANVGVALAYAAHVQQGVANFYSLHSWVGVAALVLLKSNVMGGLLAALLPGWRLARFSGGVHRGVGLGVLVTLFVAAVTGLAEMQMFVVRDAGDPFAPTALFAVVLGVLTVVVGSLVVAAVVTGRGAVPVVKGAGKVVDEGFRGDENAIGSA